jgi:hypothetical protein
MAWSYRLSTKLILLHSDDWNSRSEPCLFTFVTFVIEPRGKLMQTGHDSHGIPTFMPC